ncbi:MAG TPA: hypothetical protein VFM25_01970, partial [Verrucomicrobiae bacterium]|nr:hypothetical protein [Verrucomicrobiae bacterium]
LPEVADVEIFVCGIQRRSLVSVDKDFSWMKDPRQLIFESLHEMAKRVDDHHYFINIEDDILLPRETFRNVLEFDRETLINECLHPNRIEVFNGKKLPNDPVRRRRIWTCQEKCWQGKLLRVAANPHSGILMLSREKLRYCLQNIDLNFRGRVIGGEMESAFAHFHKPFSLYRPYKNLDFHVVIHQDRHHPHWTMFGRAKTLLRRGGIKDMLQCWVSDNLV